MAKKDSGSSHAAYIVGGVALAGFVYYWFYIRVDEESVDQAGANAGGSAAGGASLLKAAPGASIVDQRAEMALGLECVQRAIADQLVTGWWLESSSKEQAFYNALDRECTDNNALSDRVKQRIYEKYVQ